MKEREREGCYDGLCVSTDSAFLYLFSGVVRFHNHFHNQRRLRGARTDAESTLWRGFVNSVAFPSALVADSVLSIPHWKGGEPYLCLSFG